MGLSVKHLCAVVVGFVLIWCSSIPLGVPGEWTWSRSPIADDFWFSLIPAVGWGVIAGLLVWFGCGRIESCSHWERTAWLSGLFLASFGLLSGLREAAPPEFRSAKVAWVLYYQGSSGYFTEARKIRDTREFLSHYEQEVQKGDVLHQGTHPPGLILGYRGLMWACGRLEWLRRGLLATQPEDLREAFKIIGQASLRTATPLTEQDRCVLWLAALLMQACAAATVIPLYGLLRLHCTRVTSWLLASFWPLVPAVTVFSPKSDTCFPFVGCLVLALWLHGLSKSSRLSCLAAGMVFWLGMMLSLVMLPVACLAGLLTAWSVWGRVRDERLGGATASDNRAAIGRFFRMLPFAGIGFVLPAALFGIATDCNLVTVWGWNYQNHAGFYARYPRTYWKWLLVNPLELSFAVGLPLMVLALSGWRHYWNNARGAASGPFWMSLLTWSLLWLTGKNMGEAARLWLFLMPWIIWSAASGWQAANGVNHDVYATRRRWLFCWICQFLAALTVITRIAGFHAHG